MFVESIFNASQFLFNRRKPVTSSDTVQTHKVFDAQCKRPLCLPLEIITSILEAAYYDENLEPDTKLLTNSALVCNAWAAPAQNLLFRTVTLRSSTGFSSFREAVDPCTRRGKKLGHAVVRLRVIVDHNHPDQLSHRALSLAICLCPNLYELDLALYGCLVPGPYRDVETNSIRTFRAAPSFDADTLDALRKGPHIRSLKFSNWSDNDQLTFQLLSGVWSSLEFVSLKGTPPRLPALDTETPIPFSNSLLKELRLGFHTTPKSDFIRWLLHSTRQSLRCLEIDRDLGMLHLDTLLSPNIHSIESLSIPSCMTREEVAIVEKCDRLKEFRFESPMFSPVLLERLPKTIEHLALTVSRETPLYLAIKFIKSRAGSKLSALTLHVWNDGSTHPQLPSLKIASACAGVKLNVIRDIYRFRETVSGDPLPQRSFPREKNVSNLQTMLCISVTSRNATERSLPSFPPVLDLPAKFCVPDYDRASFMERLLSREVPK